jgi:hypothetical protein
MPGARTTLSVVNIVLNSGFTLLELLIAIATKKDYFIRSSFFYNFLDLIRIVLIYYGSLSILTYDENLPVNVEVAMHFFAWFKYIKNLQVF